MNYIRLRICQCLLMIVAVSVPLSGTPPGKDTTQFSGSYRILNKADSGGQAQVRVRIHLANRSTRELRIQRITLWDFSHPTKGGTQSCSIVVPSHGSTDTSGGAGRGRASFWKACFRMATPPRRS